MEITILRPMPESSLPRQNLGHWVNCESRELHKMETIHPQRKRRKGRKRRASARHSDREGRAHPRGAWSGRAGAPRTRFARGRWPTRSDRRIRLDGPPTFPPVGNPVHPVILSKKRLFPQSPLAIFACLARDWLFCLAPLQTAWELPDSGFFSVLPAKPAPRLHKSSKSRNASFTAAICSGVQVPILRMRFPGSKLASP